MKQSISGRNPHDGRPIEVIVHNGRVQAIRPGRAEEEAWLSPGLVDLQINGYGGDDVNACGIDPDVIHSLTKKVITTGVTTYLPTIITASAEKIIAALRAVAEARRRSKMVADAVPYVHVEGPNISPVDGYRGPETYWFVQLSRPVCVGEDEKEPDLNPAKKDVGSIQLVLAPDAYAAYKELVGKRVVASGTLFGAITGHHHTPVLLTVRTLSAVNP